MLKKQIMIWINHDIIECGIMTEYLEGKLTGNRQPETIYRPITSLQSIMSGTAEQEIVKDLLSLNCGIAPSLVGEISRDIMSEIMKELALFVNNFLDKQDEPI